MSQSLGVMFDMSAPANADLSAATFKALKWVTGKKVDVAGAGEVVCGVLQNKPKADEAAAIRHAGTTKLVVDGSGTAILVGDKLKADGSGRGIKTTVDGDEMIGYAMEASSAANDIIEVQLALRQV